MALSASALCPARHRQPGRLLEENLVRYATEIGLDAESFRACLHSEDAQVYAQGSYQRAVQLGIPGTPTFFLSTAKGSKSTAYAALERAIEAALRQTQQ